MIRKATCLFAVLVVAGPLAAAETKQPQPQLDRKKLPGRQVKVAAICIGFGGNHAAKLKQAIGHLHTAGGNGVDIACLPEEFAGTRSEPVDGPTTQAVAKLARQYNMYVICPIREQAGKQQYNTAVLIDRKGRVAGTYRKIFVYWGEKLHCSRQGVKVFDTDSCANSTRSRPSGSTSTAAESRLTRPGKPAVESSPDGRSPLSPGAPAKRRSRAATGRGATSCRARRSLHPGLRCSRGRQTKTGPSRRSG